MKKKLLLGVAFGAFSAFATANTAVAAPPFTWTGCYVGGNGGYSWGRTKGNFNAVSNLANFGGQNILVPSSISGSTNPNGAIGGGGVGCNWQNMNWVYGFETDIQASGQKASRNASVPFNDGEGVTGAINHHLVTKIEWFGTARARAGVLVVPGILVFATGGLAYGKVSAVDTISVVSTAPFFGVTSIGDSKVKVGGTVGGGVEGTIPNWPKWTWKVEYLYINFGSLSGAGVDPLIGPYSWNAKFTDNIVRFGLNLKIP